MTLLVCDYATSAYFCKYTSASGTLPTILDPGYSFVTGSTGFIYYSIPERSEVFVRFGFRWTVSPGSSNVTFLSLLSAGITIASIDYIGSDNKFLFKIGNDLVSTPVYTFTTNKYYDVDLRFKIDSINGIFEARIGNTTLYDDSDQYSGIIRAPAGALTPICYAGNTIPAGMTTLTGIDTIGFGKSSSVGTLNFSGWIIINDALGTEHNWFMHGTEMDVGDAAYEIGSFNEWNFTGAAYKDGAVDNDPPLESQYAYTEADELRDSFFMWRPYGWWYFGPYGEPEPPEFSENFKLIAIESLVAAKKVFRGPDKPMGFFHAVVEGATVTGVPYGCSVSPGAGTIYYNDDELEVVTGTDEYSVHYRYWPVNPVTGLPWDGDIYGESCYEGDLVFQTGIVSKTLTGNRYTHPELLHLNVSNDEKWVMIFIDGVCNELAFPDVMHLNSVLHYKPSAGAVPATTFNDAVNNESEFRFGGNSGTSWGTTSEPGLIAGQSGVLVDQSGAPNNYFSMPAYGPGVLEFWWAVDTATGGAELEFFLSGDEQESISGPNATLVWTLVRYEIPENEYREFAWNFINYSDPFLTGGRDAGYVRDIHWTGEWPEIPDITFNEAVENEVLSFSHGGNAQWHPTIEPNLIAVDSGDIDADQVSWFTATVTGPGTISFWWDIDASTVGTRVEFYIDTSRSTYITGWTYNWYFENVTRSVGSGTHTLKWQYIKDSGAPTWGRNKGVVKDIVWTPS